MLTSQDPQDALFRFAATQLTGWQRRIFVGEVTNTLCAGNARRSERRFGWGRETARKGMEELAHGVRHVENDSTRGRPRSEVRNPQLGIDVRAIVEPHTQADPEMRSTRCYANLTAAEVRQELIDHKGYQEKDLPTERTFRSMLNRMNYRLRRIQKSKPLKKTMETDAIFENVERVRTEARLDPHTLEISIDTKAKVAVGEYSRGGKTRSDSEGKTPKALDHDTGQKKS